jgi:hypothetical protein
VIIKYHDFITLSKMDFSHLSEMLDIQAQEIFSEYIAERNKIVSEMFGKTHKAVSWNDTVDEEHVPYVEEKHHHDGETYYDDGENLSTGCSICKKIGHRKDQCLWLKPEERGRRCANCRQLGHCKSKCFQPEAQTKQRRCGICGNNEHTKANCSALIPFYERV